MNIKRFAIVKLRKSSYDLRHSTFKCDLLVLRSVYNTQEHNCNPDTYIVRYPDGFTQAVGAEEIIPSSISELSSTTYFTRHQNNPVVMFEFEKNDKFREILLQYQPNSPLFSAKPKDIKKYEDTEPCTTVIEVPELPPVVEEPIAIPAPEPEPVTLESLDKKIQLILEYIKAGDTNVQS